jgi:two-component SAPR family response regulator
MNGVEFLPLTAKSAVVIILTTSLNPRDVEQLQRLPIDGYLTKPLTREKINHVLQEHFPVN